jgi:hypothetical protein
MEKKDILSGASNAVNEKKPNWFVRAWRWIKRQAGRFWSWVKRDRLVAFNILLLALLCAMLIFMLSQVRCRNDKSAPAAQPAASQRAASRSVYQGRPTIVVSRNSEPLVRAKVSAQKQRSVQKVITLPIKREIPVAKKAISGTIVIDGRGRNIKLPPMASISGDLFLQNLRTYTLPCGTRINGDLYLRNVALLKFCGCFEVVGNIYVSRSSSFGPIPKDAYLGGQIVF